MYWLTLFPLIACTNPGSDSSDSKDGLDTAPPADTAGEDTQDTETGDTETGDTETGDTETGDTETGDTGTDQTISVAGNFYQWDSGAPLDGAEVCWRTDSADVCTKTSTRGRFVLDGIATGATGGLWILHPDIVPTVLAMVTGEADLDLALVFESPEAHDRFYAAVGVTDDVSLSTISVIVVSDHGDPSGATASLSPASGSGPWYVPAHELTLDPALTATTELGSAYFLAVDPAEGPFALTVESPGGECVGEAYGATLPSAFDAPAGTTVNVMVTCP